MSFGWSGSDVFFLTQLAWNTVQNSRKACGEYDGLTREALRLHAVLQRLEQEVAKSDSSINRPGETSKEQLERIVTDCEVVLKQLEKIVTAYAALSEEKRSVRKIWQRVRFGNGQMADLGDLRSKLTLYTSEMLLYLNFISMSTVGRIEQRMDRDGGVLRDIKIAVEKKTAHNVLCGGNREGSILTSYTDDDTGFWKELRRDLVKDGLPSAAIHKHKHLIKKYIKELGDRGILDDHSSQDFNQQQYDTHPNPEIIKEAQEFPNDFNTSPNISQTRDHNVDNQLSENSTEQTLWDPSKETIAGDTERELPSTESRTTASQTIVEPSKSITGNVGIRMEAKSNPQTYTSISDSQGHIPSIKSVPLRSAKDRSPTTLGDVDTSRSGKTYIDDLQSTGGNTGNHTPSPGELSLLFWNQRSTNFVVTSSGICHRPNFAYWNGISLYERFGECVNVILECLRDRSVPDPGPHPPQDVPGRDPEYAADVEAIASFAREAQGILNFISDSSDDPSTSLIDFRPEDFTTFTSYPEGMKAQWARDQEPFFTRMHEFFAAFDGQCYDAVRRIRHRGLHKSSANHPVPSNFSSGFARSGPESSDSEVGSESETTEMSPAPPRSTPDQREVSGQTSLLPSMDFRKELKRTSPPPKRPVEDEVDARPKFGVLPPFQGERKSSVAPPPLPPPSYERRKSYVPPPFQGERKSSVAPPPPPPPPPSRAPMQSSPRTRDAGQGIKRATAFNSSSNWLQNWLGDNIQKVD